MYVQIIVCMVEMAWMYCHHPDQRSLNMINRTQDKRVRRAWLPDPEDLNLPAFDSPKLQQDAQAALRAFALVPDALSVTGYARIYGQLHRFA